MMIKSPRISGSGVQRRSPALLLIAVWAAFSTLPAAAQQIAPIAPLFFTKPFSGANPLPQVLTVLGTSSDVQFTATASTNSGGNWLVVTPDDGCGTFCGTPKAITVSINTNTAFSAGTYTGQIVITPRTGAVVAVPVTLTVVPLSSTFLDNLPGALSFSLKTAAQPPPPQLLQIRNGGTGSLAWNISTRTSDGGNWLAVSTNSGTAPSTVTVSITPGSLPGSGIVAGTFSGQILVQTANGATSVPVSVAVGDNVFRQVNPISFTKSFAGANPLPQTLTIASTGPGEVQFTASSATATGGAWLSVAENDGCGTYCSTPKALTVSITAGVTLAAGTYTGEILIAARTGSMSMTIPVTLTVTSPGTPFLDNLPGQVSFSLKTRAPAPPSQTVQIRNGGSGSLNWTLSTSTSDSGAWLVASTANGTTPSSIDISILPEHLPDGGLTPGTFVGQILIQTPNGNVTIPVSVVIGDAVFNQVNAINFTKVFGGADPLPQTITISSTGAELQFIDAAFTATGGSWLTVTENDGCGTYCTTPHALTVSVRPATNLAVGTYTGQVVVTARGGGATLTIPITLTIAAANTSFFDNLPGQVSFTLKTRGNGPPSQTILIRNGGSGVLNWTVTASTADGGNWLNTSANSGTAPGSVEISIVPASLPGAGFTPGSFVGNLVFQGGGSTVTIPVSVTVGNDVFQQVNGISFVKQFAGANPLPQVITIAGTGSDLQFIVTSSTATGGNWLSVTANDGCGTYCVTPKAVTAKITAPATLAAGIYTGQIVITARSGNIALTIPVTLTVASSGSAFLDNLPGALSFLRKTNGATPPSQRVQIRNGGTGALNWTLAITTADGGAWLTASATSGTAPSFVDFAIVPANLPGGGLLAGTFEGEIVVQGGGAKESIPVSVVIGDSVFNQVNPISFTKVLSGFNPLPQTLTIASTNANLNFIFEGSTATGGAWMAVNANDSCGTYCNTPKAMTVAITASPTLPAGTYTGQVVVTSRGGIIAMTIPVSLTVVPPAMPLFDNVQGQLSYFVPVSTGNPPTHTVQLRNAGPGLLNWTATAVTADSGAWLNVSALNGTAPSTVTVGITTSSLPGGGLVPGTFIGEITFDSPTGSVSIPVSVVVGSPVFVQLDTVTLTRAVNAPSPSAQLNITSSAGSLDFIWTFSTGNGGNWLAVVDTGCGTYCTTPKTLTASLTALQLPAGTYTGQIVATSRGGVMAMTIPVILIVGGPPPATITATSGTPQSAEVGTAFANPLVVTVRDASGNPVNGVSVTFTAPSTGASGSFGGGANVAVTDSSGRATSATFTANSIAGSYTVTASVPGISAPAAFALTNTAARLTSIAISANSTIVIGGTTQFTAIGTFSDGTTSNITNSVTWLSSAPGVATINAAGLATGVAAGSTNITATMSGVTSNTVALTVTQPTVTSIAISAAATSVPRGGTTQFTAIGTFNDGTTSNITNSVAWSSSAPGVATINAAGLATGVAIGSTNITATMSGVTSNTVALTVTQPTITSIAISAAATSVPRGGTTQFTAIGTFNDGTTSNITNSVTWSSSAPSVATINAAGLATGVAIGSTNITATMSGVTSNTVALMVTQPTITSIAISAVETSIPRGGTAQFAAIGTFNDGTTSNVTSSVTWVSSAPGVATINAAGLATGVAVGSTNITATMSGVTSNTVALTVTQPTVTSIAISAPATSIPRGGTAQFTAIGTFNDGTTSNITSSVTWSSSAPGVATINAAGLATGVAIGSTNITATMSGVTSNTVALTVTQPTVTSIAISAAATSIPRGGTTQFTAIGTFNDGSTSNITSSVTWSSSAPGVATINAAGLATGVAIGSTNITATMSGVTSNTVALTVTQPTVTSIAISAAATSIPRGGTTQFTAIGTFNDGTTSNITSSVTWVSSAPGVATINAAGLATGVAIGSTNISATMSGVTSNTVALTVTQPTVTSIAISAAATSIPRGGTTQFTAIGTFNDGSTSNITNSVTWVSSAPGVATINAAGLATGVAVGSTNITATMSGVTSNTVALTVTQPTVTSIAISAAATSIPRGGTAQFTAIGTFNDGSTSNITNSVTWVSSAPGVATINAAGLATGVAVGSTNITATMSGVTSNTVALTVTQPTVTSIAISAAATSVPRGGTTQFTAIGSFNDGTTSNITSSVTWVSSAPGVATINAAGLATGVAVGSTNITATMSGVTSNTVALTVTQPTITSIAISAAATSVPQGGTTQFTAIGTFNDGTTSNITSSVTWVSSAPGVATINAAGLATGVATGSTNITATMSGVTSNSVALTVTQPALTSIAIAAPTTSIPRGGTAQFTAIGTFNGGTTSNITSSVTWVSSAPGVATINAAGLANGVAAGSANIAASLAGVTSNNVTLTVIALPPTVASITISAPSASLTQGANQQFTAIATYSDGSTANVTSLVTWNSSSPGVATINSAGLVTALATGSTTITGTISGVVSNPFNLTVSPVPVPVVVEYRVLFGTQSYNLIGSSRNRLPWQITGIQAVFSEPITNGTAASLTGVTATGFNGLGTNTLTWTFAPVPLGTLTTALAGSGINALLNATGNPLGGGTGFAQVLRVLLGDFNDDGVISAGDLVGVNNATNGAYNVFADVNGDGLVNISDVQTVRSRIGTSLL